MQQKQQNLSFLLSLSKIVKFCRFFNIYTAFYIPIKYRLTFFNSLQLSIYQYIIINFNLYTIKLLLYQIILVYLHMI